MVPTLLKVISKPLSDSRSVSPDMTNGTSTACAAFAASDLLVLQQSLFTLTNVAALSDWHPQFCGALTRLFSLTHSVNSKVRMQSLRILVNLSTNEEMVPHLLAAKVRIMLVFEAFLTFKSSEK